MTTTNDKEFPIGSRVVLQNLKSGSQYNGKVGNVRSSLTASGRQEVFLVGSSKDEKMLALKPANLIYQPRSINSLSISEIKKILASTGVDIQNLRGTDKAQLRDMIREHVSSETEIAAILHSAPPFNPDINSEEVKDAKSNISLKEKASFQAEQLSKMNPEQLRSQAAQMRSMPTSTIRQLNPAMSNFTDAQIHMAANQMEMMANNPQMINSMADQMKNMNDEQIEELRTMQKQNIPGSGMSASPETTNQVNPNIVKDASEINLTPDQLKQQASMLKSMSPSSVRSLNPAMADWDDSQIQMAAQQMEQMANNPMMMESFKKSIDNMSPESLEMMQKNANKTNGPSTASRNSDTPAGNLASPNEAINQLQNMSPGQIKSMISMIKSNPMMLKEMLRSSGQETMASQLDEQKIKSTLAWFEGVSEEKIAWILKLVGMWQTHLSGRDNRKNRLFLGFFLICMLCLSCYTSYHFFMWIWALVIKLYRGDIDGESKIDDDMRSLNVNSNSQKVIESVSSDEFGEF